MTGTIWIDFEPRGDALPRILGLVEADGYALREIRVIPCRGERRSTLLLDLADRGRGDLMELERRLGRLDETLTVIASAPARAAR